jgi:enolase
MEATITIKTNRIFFERFEAPCGEPEVSEIKNTWSGAIYDVIEAAGFTAETEIDVGFDPAVQKFVTVESDSDCDCEDENSCTCGYKEEAEGFVKICEKFGELIAEQAEEAGYEAAAAKSKEFVEKT